MYFNINSGDFYIKFCDILISQIKYTVLISVCKFLVAFCGIKLLEGTTSLKLTKIDLHVYFLKPFDRLNI